LLSGPKISGFLVGQGLTLPSLVKHWNSYEQCRVLFGTKNLCEAMKKKLAGNCGASQSGYSLDRVRQAGTEGNFMVRTV
jgi:hypothetical protein